MPQLNPIVSVLRIYLNLPAISGSVLFCAVDAPPCLYYALGRRVAAKPRARSVSRGVSHGVVLVMEHYFPGKWRRTIKKPATHRGLLEAIVSEHHLDKLLK